MDYPSLYDVAEVQHELLLLTAENCEDTMEHCRLMLLLFNKFPATISQHGVSVGHYAVTVLQLRLMQCH